MTNLLTEIQNYKSAMAGKIPTEIREIMQKAGAEIAATGVGKNAPKPGDMAPDFTLPNAKGQQIKLSDLYKSGPVVLIFYRGGWCPFCNLELRAYQREIERFKKAGINIVAVSPEKPDHSLSTKEKNELVFEILSDVKNDVARLYGLLFDLPQALIPIYQSFGVDLLEHNSTKTWSLPVPGTFAIAQGGKIKLAMTDVDYTNRLEPMDCFAALQRVPS